MTKLPVALAAALSAAVLVSASGASLAHARPERAAAPSVLNMATQTDVPSLDPAVGVDTESVEFVDAIYGQLVTYAPTGQTIVGDLASHWSWNRTGTQLTMDIRPTARFSNGDPVTAQDVLFSVEFMLNPKATASLPIYAGLVGATAYSKHPTGSFPGVTVINSHTVRFNLSQPEPYFLAALTSGSGSILDPKVVAPLDFNAAKISADPVGAGPYKLQKYVAGQDLVLVKNSYYWNRGLPKTDEINVRIGLSPTSQLLLFQQGKLDVIGGGLSDSLQIDSSSFLQQYSNPSLHKDYMSNVALETYYMYLNTQMKPFQNVDVRHAIFDAIDRSQLVRILNGRAVPANQVIPPGMFGHDPSLPALKTNLAQARSLLKAAGYPGGKGLTFTMVGFNDPTSIKIESAIQAQLQQLGIHVVVKPEALGPLIQGVLTPNTDQAGYALWQDDYADPEDFMWNMFYSKNPGGWDISFYSNPKLDALITAGDTTLSNAGRLSDYNEAQKLALASYAWIPLFYGVTDILKSPSVEPSNKLYYLHPVLQLQLQYLYKK